MKIYELIVTLKRRCQKVNSNDVVAYDSDLRKVKILKKIYDKRLEHPEYRNMKCFIREVNRGISDQELLFEQNIPEKRLWEFCTNSKSDTGFYEYPEPVPIDVEIHLFSEFGSDTTKEAFLVEYHPTYVSLFIRADDEDEAISIRKTVVLSDIKKLRQKSHNDPDDIERPDISDDYIVHGLDFEL